MKPVDKALLTQELSELIRNLKDGRLSYFDHARAKQRILDIQQLCAYLLQPNMQTNQHQHLEPLLYAQDFVHTSRYRAFCCGVFSQDKTLEDILYQQPQSTWALLYEPDEGWQIWLLQMPNQTLLISDSGELDTVYAWLVAQQLKYACFDLNHLTPTTRLESSPQDTQPMVKADPTLAIAAVQPMAPMDPVEAFYAAKQEYVAPITVSHLPDVVPVKVRPELPQQDPAPLTPTAAQMTRILRKQETDISQGLDFDLGLEPLDLAPPAQPQTSRQANVSKVEPEPIKAVVLDPILLQKSQRQASIQADVKLFEQANSAPSIALTTQTQASVETAPKRVAVSRPKKSDLGIDFSLQGQSCKVSALLFASHDEHQLYRITPQLNDCPHIDLILHYQEHDQVLQKPIYLAEQINNEGHFIKYLALFGAQGELQAVRLAHLFSQAQAHQIAAVKVLDWPDLEQNLWDFETLFQSYDASARLIWAKQNYYAFIPAYLLQTQKFIQFIEAPATVQTPVLLLKERQKIRIIHGENRLNITPSETAYPYLLLDRQDGISWQLIQEVIHQLPQPIDPITLYQTICAQMG
jgi:hypothetical protein